jgi:hypothetical protein
MTRTTAKTRRRAFFWLAFLLLEATVVRSLAAAIPRNPWSVFGVVGIGISQQAAVRKIYGNVRVPFQCGVQFRFSEHWMMDAALAYLNTGGQTRIVGSDSADENYRTRLALFSFQLGVRHRWLLKRLQFSVGGGGSWNFYREEWPDADIRQNGHGAGFWAVAGGEYPLISRFFLVGKIQYSSIPTGQGSALERKVNLGGGELLLGIAVHL